MKKLKILVFILFVSMASCSDDENQTIQDTPTSQEPPTTEEPVFSAIELQVLKWFENQQSSNGLVESVENGNIVSLYDNALAALVFMLNEDYSRAEDIFDFF